MSARILSTAIIAGLLLAEKAKDMKWDDAKKACVKK